MKIDQLTQEALALGSQGMSLRRIAEELGTSKSTIERKLKTYDESGNVDERCPLKKD